MSRILAAAFGAVVLVGGIGPAQAAQPAPHCKVLSSSSQTQTRDVTGVVMGVTWVNGQPVNTYGHGIQHRTQTTTTQRCRGKVSTTVAYTAWAY